MDKVTKRLRWAVEWGPCVRIYRNHKDWDRLDGYVVGLSDDWLMIHRLSDTFVLDGYEVIRTNDVRKVVSPPGQDFPHRALTLRGFTRQPQPEIDLTSVGNLLLSANAHEPLVTVHLEARWRDICFIRIVARVGMRRLYLKKIDSRACWIDEEKFALKDITRVSFGGGYEDALWTVSQDRARQKENKASK